MTEHRLEDLVQNRLLYPRTSVQEWMVPGSETEPAPSAGYVVSFLAFHEHGLGVLPSDFFWGCSSTTAWSYST